MKKKKNEIVGLDEKVTEQKDIREKLNDEAKFRARIYAIGFFLVLATTIGTLIYLVLTSTNPDMKIILTVFTLLLLLAGYIVSSVNLKEWSPAKFPEQLYEKEKKRLYEKFGFDEIQLDSIIEELSEAKKELKKLKNI